MKTKRFEELIIAILIPLAVGLLSSLFTGNNTAVYTDLIKPDLSPPAIVFPIVWTILYIMMGIASYLIYISDSSKKEGALKLYALSLVLNFFWSILFFGFSLYLVSFFWILLLILCIVLMIVSFYQINPWASLLLIPYLLWTIFAAYLNFMIFVLNK